MILLGTLVLVFVIILLALALLYCFFKYIELKKLNKALINKLNTFSEIEKNKKKLSELNEFRKSLEMFGGATLEVRNMDEDAIFYREPA